MLRWRLLLGTILIGALVGLCWLDYLCPVPGAVLLPVAVIFSLGATGECLTLARAAAGNFLGASLSVWPIYVGNAAILLGAWAPVLWHPEAPSGGCSAGALSFLLTAYEGILFTLMGFFLLAMLEEIRRFDGPGGILLRLGITGFCLLYGGLLLSFLVLLRIQYGLGALASLVIVVKMADTAAYTVGHLIGRHKLAPRLSPGKTIEGTIGGLLGGWLAAWAVFTWVTPALSPPPAAKGSLRWIPVGVGEGSAPGPGVFLSAHLPPWWGWTSYALVLGIVGLGGDLAESLLKRDAQRKDSSQWMPGFGGLLDLLDSLLWAAPVAYLWWHLGWVR